MKNLAMPSQTNLSETSSANKTRQPLLPRTHRINRNTSGQEAGRGEASLSLLAGRARKGYHNDGPGGNYSGY
jgi:hypothetical protein